VVKQFRITAKMKQIPFVVIAMLSVCVPGCKTDAAVNEAR
jgi:hypothetical protein